MPKKICTNCEFVGYPKYATKGSLLIEIILWLFFIIPGIFYSIWRRTNQAEICPKCSQAFMIPFDSPKAKQYESLISNEKSKQTEPQSPIRWGLFIIVILIIIILYILQVK